MNSTKYLLPIFACSLLFASCACQTPGARSDGGITKSTGPLPQGSSGYALKVVLEPRKASSNGKWYLGNVPKPLYPSKKVLSLVTENAKISVTRVSGLKIPKEIPYTVKLTDGKLTTVTVLYGTP